MSVRALAIAAVALLLVGCGYTEMHELALRGAAAPSSPVERERVEIYMATQTPPRPFREVALLQAVGHGSDANVGDVVKALTTSAAKHGCDAIARVQIDQGFSLAHGFAVCIAWLPAPPPAAMPAPPPAAPPPAPAPAPSGTSI